MTPKEYLGWFDKDLKEKLEAMRLRGRVESLMKNYGDHVAGEIIKLVDEGKL